MPDKAVELSVAGKTCRVITTADEDELRALAAMVEEKLQGVLTPGRPVNTEAMLLAAVALAHDVRTERARSDAIASKAKSTLEGLLIRVDEALDQNDEVVSSRRRQKSKPKSKLPTPPRSSRGTGRALHQRRHL